MNTHQCWHTSGVPLTKPSKNPIRQNVLSWTFFPHFHETKTLGCLVSALDGQNPNREKFWQKTFISRARDKENKISFFLIIEAQPSRFYNGLTHHGVLRGKHSILSIRARYPKVWDEHISWSKDQAQNLIIYLPALIAKYFSFELPWGNRCEFGIGNK